MKQENFDFEGFTKSTYVQLMIEYGAGNVYKGIQYASSLYLAYPKQPQKPVLSKNHSASELKKYATDFELYEVDYKKYKTDRDTYNQHKYAIESSIEMFIKEVSEFNEVIPKDKQDKVWNKSYSDGHSSGLYEVYLCLCELVELFK